MIRKFLVSEDQILCSSAPALHGRLRLLKNTCACIGHNGRDGKGYGVGILGLGAENSVDLAIGLCESHFTFVEASPDECHNRTMVLMSSIALMFNILIDRAIGSLDQNLIDKLTIWENTT